MKKRDALLSRVRGGVTPGPTRRARLRKLVVGGLAASVSAGTTATAAAAVPTAVSLSLGWKLAGLAVVVAAAGTAGWARFSPTPERHEAPADEVTVAPSVPVAAVAPEVHDEPAAPPPSTPILEPSAPSLEPAVLAPRPRRAARAARAEAPPAAPEAPAPEATGLEATGFEPTVLEPTATGDAFDAVGRETALVRGARAALERGDGALALRLLDEHARTFAGGLLADDRDLLRVRALCALGRDEAASEAASSFVAGHPGSAYARALAAPCD